MDKHLDYFEVRWKNFKGFADTKWIKIKPITIVLGVNNSGKTNFLAPFLLMNQTINSRDRYSTLILKGDIYDGGNFQEIVKDYDVNKDIVFGYRYHVHAHDSIEVLDKKGDSPPGGFEVTFKVDEKEGEIKLSSSEIYDIYNRKLSSLTRSSNGSYKYTGIGKESLNKREIDGISRQKPTNFLFSPNPMLADLELGEEDEESGEPKKKKRGFRRFTKGFTQFLSIISYNNVRAIRYLGDLSFIGPIRENPHRIYEITNETYNTVGPMGENMPNLLKKIGDNDSELNKWIKLFGLGDKLQLTHHYSNSYSLRFLKNNSTYYTSIANSGFGASQVLPLIVQSLVSPKGSITVAEQPEIHLNPRIQCTLADLFVSIAEKGQTIILETHSEHILLRLRRLIADEKIEADKVAIYFVEKEGNESTIREIKLQTNGHIDPIDWPKDFFGDTLKESFALAKSQARKSKND